MAGLSRHSTSTTDGSVRWPEGLGYLEHLLDFEWCDESQHRCPPFGFSLGGTLGDAICGCDDGGDEAFTVAVERRTAGQADANDAGAM